MPKILILGWARHGKDTAASFLRDDFGFSFCSSSLFAAQEIVRPALARMGKVYATLEECYADRVNQRKLWYEAICKFNEQDPARLGRKIFQQHDLYVGLRNVREFEALQADKAFDLCIWIDATGRGLPPEAKQSCSVQPSHADVIVNNNGTLAELRQGLRDVISRRFPDLVCL